MSPFAMSIREPVKTIRVALAGNPNAGKSTLFNRLTGAQQHVGNWPGKTVARMEGYFDENDTQVRIVDLPGTYSLSAYSPEEEITRDYIVDHHPDLVVNVVDAANLERNLYLTTQILEAGARLILVLNMSDVATQRGYQIDCEKLSQRLGGVPVIPAVARNGTGLAELRGAIVRASADRRCACEENEVDDDAYAGARPRFGKLRGCH
jgi:ferrous iron transport protein B